MSEDYLGYFPDAELVIGLVHPIGTDYEPVLSAITDFLRQFEYDCNVVHLSSRFDEIADDLRITTELPPGGSEFERMKRKIGLGNAIRAKSKKDHVMALLAAAEIHGFRTTQGDATAPLPKTAHIIVSLKRPEEVECLRRIYGMGFYLVGVAANKRQREEYLKDRRGLAPEEIQKLTDIDANESTDPQGQQTRKTFYLSDVFVSLDNHSKELQRFLDLCFQSPEVTPTRDEYGMYLAYSASLRSGDLARQVGAAITDQDGAVLALGCNDVPKFGGGLYWTEDIDKRRDIELKYDANDREKAEMAVKIMRLIKPGTDDSVLLTAAKSTLEGTGFFDITEFGRSVHAEMDALLACARTSRTTQGATLYTTTFPCHNCTRHIIAAGVRRTVYIEPYAKSKAFQLHADAITDDTTIETKLPFVPFIGIGPRRYLDLFSLTLGTGTPRERKDGSGNLIAWEKRLASPRLQMQPNSYLQRESFASGSLRDILEGNE